MSSIIIVMLLSAVFGGAVWSLYLKEEIKNPVKRQDNAVYIIAVMAVGAIAHVIGAVCYYGHPTDMGCFSGWSSRIFNDGLRDFYASDGFHDYPPGYVYIMYILGAVKETLSLSEGGLWLWLKLPSIIADMVMGWLTYKIASKKFSQSASAIFAALIVLNPAVILNSSIWGQIDSILALFCLLSVYCVAERKYIPSFFWFAAGVLIKPQAAFFAPVIIFGLIDELFIREKFDFGKFIKLAIWALAAIAAMLVLFMPFGENPLKGIAAIIEQYTKTLGEYPYLTINAFNIYGALGRNWAGLGTAMSVIGYSMIAVAVAYGAYVFFKSKSPAKYYITAFVISFCIYMLAIKMHERYAFPAIFMLMFALISLPTAKSFIMYGLFSLSQFFNMAWILFIYNQDINKYYRDPVVAAASVINIIIFAVCLYFIQKECVEYKPEPAGKAGAKSQNRNVKAAPVGYSRNAKKTVSAKQNTERSFTVSAPKLKIGAVDYIAMAVIIVVYSVIALHNLGNKFAPETEITLSDKPVTIDLGSERDISKTEFYLGARQLEENRSIDFKFLDSGKNVVGENTVTSGSVFYWDSCDTSAKARYITLSTTHVPSETDPTDVIYIKEVCVLDGDGNTIEPVNADDKSVSALFDEQDKFVEGKNFMSETYFDEIYHGRTAYEFIHHMTVYEWTHPPLGKLLMSIGIRIFGMNPFGWRVVGTVFGIFMIPVIYLFALRIFRKSWLSIVVCLIFTFDFMHFAQTRIATIDVYVTFFIMLMYYFMYKYYKMSFNDTPLKKTLVPLGLSGIFFGLAAASKWTGFYAGAGIFVIFLYVMYRRYSEYRYAVTRPKGVTSGIEHQKVINDFSKNIKTTFIFFVIMFAAVAFMIYALSYIPYLMTPSGHGFKTIFDNASSMLTYHSKTVANSTHPYSSHWYEWPIMYRPIWYFSNTTAQGLKQGISSFGNPAVWWVGIPAFAYLLALAFVIPLKARGYYGRNKYMIAGVFAAVLGIICVMAYLSGMNNEKLERLFKCVLFYSAVIEAALLIVLTFDESIKQISNRTIIFILIGYFIEILPWVGVVRTTYIYHYFPCVPFVALMIGYSIKTFYDNAKNKKAVIVGSFIYAEAAVALFALFYPVISGKPISLEFAETWLKWFSSWVLVA